VEYTTGKLLNNMG